MAYHDGSTTTYTWDAGNRVTQVVDSLAGTIARTYDLLDRLTQETTPQGTVTYTYDAAGRRTSMTVTGQTPVTYTYDNADRPTQITQGSAVVGFGYDGAGRRTSLTLPNGIVTEYAYDAASRLTGLTYSLAGTTLGTLTYTYDAAGNRTQVGGTWARTGLPQPLPSATYNAANQQLTFGGQALTYDLNGNLTSDGANTYTWNARNQLIAINGASVTATFDYDGLGRRRSKTINGASTQFLYDDVTPVQEIGASPATLLTGFGIDEYLTRTDAAGMRTFLSDALGSTVALADSAGAVQSEYTYEPFGAVTATGTDTNPFQYTGRENDGTGLYYYRARYYHPALQRFVSEDPIGFAGGINLYAYVVNSPVRWRDPVGLDVTITGWGCCFGFGHVGIGVNTSDTVGFYPMNQHHMFDRGVVLLDSTRFWPWEQFNEPIVIKTTTEQDRRIQEFINRRMAVPGNYNILSGRHCGGFVQEALREADIDPFQDVASPRSFFEALKALNDAGVDFTRGVTRLVR